MSICAVLHIHIYTYVRVHLCPCITIAIKSHKARSPLTFALILAAQRLYFIYIISCNKCFIFIMSDVLLHLNIRIYSNTCVLAFNFFSIQANGDFIAVAFFGWWYCNSAIYEKKSGNCGKKSKPKSSIYCYMIIQGFIW